jgi:hypothetical protein
MYTQLRECGCLFHLGTDKKLKNFFIEISAYLTPGYQFLFHKVAFSSQLFW